MGSENGSWDVHRNLRCVTRSRIVRSSISPWIGWRMRTSWTRTQHRPHVGHRSLRRGDRTWSRIIHRSVLDTVEEQTHWYVEGTRDIVRHSGALVILGDSLLNNAPLLCSPPPLSPETPSYLEVKGKMCYTLCIAHRDLGRRFLCTCQSLRSVLRKVCTGLGSGADRFGVSWDIRIHRFDVWISIFLRIISSLTHLTLWEHTCGKRVAGSWIASRARTTRRVDVGTPSPVCRSWCCSS